MRYFLGHVLGLGEQEKPEDLRRIRATDKGTLVHKVLEDYVDGVLAGQPRSLPRLLDLAEREFGDYQARGLTGAPLLWRYERELVRRELTRFFAEDDLTPLATELVFGADGQEPVTITLAGGRQVSFRGQVDRVDRTPGGGLCVTDYKTGSGRGYEDIEKDPVAGGRRLQLPLYGLAARARFGGDPVEARYWVVSEKADFKRVGITVDEAVEARLHEVVGVMVGGITAGRFPARPGEEDWRGGWDHCRFCAFDRLCQADRDRRWERVRSSPELASYVAMAEPGEEA
jgi:RecB family exonuclease